MVVFPALSRRYMAEPLFGSVLSWPRISTVFTPAALNRASCPPSVPPRSASSPTVATPASLYMVIWAPSVVLPASLASMTMRSWPISFCTSIRPPPRSPIPPLAELMVTANPPPSFRRLTLPLPSLVENAENTSSPSVFRMVSSPCPVRLSGLISTVDSPSSARNWVRPSSCTRTRSALFTRRSMGSWLESCMDTPSV